MSTKHLRLWRAILTILDKCANHPDREGANAKQHPGEDSEPARNLREPDEASNDHGCVEKSREVLRTRPSKRAKQNRTTVIEEGSSTSAAQQKESAKKTGVFQSYLAHFFVATFCVLI